MRKVRRRKRSSFWLCELLARACRCIIKQRDRRSRNIEGIDEETIKGSTSNVVGKTWNFRVHTRLI